VRTYHRSAPVDPRPDPLLRVLNLGAGTQSTAVALMHLDGTLPPIDAAIFANTGWEPAEVYDHLGRLRGTFGQAEVPLVEVTAGNIRDDSLVPAEVGRSASLPLHVKPTDANAGRAGGIARRQCTKEYKVAPLRRAILGLVAERLGISATTWRDIPKGVYVEQVFGISTDEASRARSPNDRWAINFYPLLDLGWRRGDTIAYLERNGWNAPRSACIGCPFHSDSEWRRLRDDHPEEWEDAVAFDAEIRRVNAASPDRLESRGFLHRSLLPLSEVDLTTAEDHGQQSLFAGECEGMCGV
jgi:3'-phosphoadenosine 5'-phosphosulfate sulfotransferase (PAPS reductase)/FAD synthetase